MKKLEDFPKEMLSIIDKIKDADRELGNLLGEINPEEHLTGDYTDPVSRFCDTAIQNLRLAGSLILEASQVDSVDAAKLSARAAYDLVLMIQTLPEIPRLVGIQVVE